MTASIVFLRKGERTKNEALKVSKSNEYFVKHPVVGRECTKLCSNSKY